MTFSLILPIGLNIQDVFIYIFLLTHQVPDFEHVEVKSDINQQDFKIVDFYL